MLVTQRIGPTGRTQEMDTLLSCELRQMMRKERPTPRSPKAKQIKSLLAAVKITPCDPARVRNLPGENTPSVQARLGASRGHGEQNTRAVRPACTDGGSTVVLPLYTIVEAVD
jgi:hypothetical protein